MLTQDRLKQVVTYNPLTGLFTRVSTGKLQNTKDRKGYIRFVIDGVHYRAHRLAFLYVEGVHPPDMVDHINGVKDDNRWENLRHADNAMNMRNSKTRNSTGFRGVRKQRKGSTYLAQITIDGKNHYLGNFPTPEQAHEAYLRRRAGLP